jgi:hypothetical protein
LKTFMFNPEIVQHTPAAALKALLSRHRGI